MKFEVIPLPYLNNTEHLLRALSKHQHLIAFESGSSSHPNGTWSIVSAKPIKTIVQAAPIKELTPQINQLKAEADAIMTKTANAPLDFPFAGGVLGVLPYDAGSLQFTPTKTSGHPAFAGIYTWALLFNHYNKNLNLVTWNHPDSLSKDEICSLVFDLESNNKTSISKSAYAPAVFKPLWSTGDYGKAFDATKDYIKSGDVYQINLTQRFDLNERRSPIESYLYLKDISVSPYLCYAHIKEDLVLASASPEMFLEVNQCSVTTKPIKGTRPVSNNEKENLSAIHELTNSPKDRAENIMIVDLLRNDLSITCEKVQVNKLCEVESFELVHHLVSTIQATKKNNITSFDVFANAFPGGSITGAPKKRAMEIIDELEGSYRSYYCGSAFAWSHDDQLRSNILIRSFVFEGSKVTCWGGGGIVDDSEKRSEYEESLNKVSRLMSSI